MNRSYKKNISLENFIFIIVFFGIFSWIGHIMGPSNMLSTIMNTAYRLLMDTCFYIMGISVIAGALSSLFSEFGFIALVDVLLSKIMKPIYNLPGASSLGILNCYLSDNPAILTLADEDNFKKYFRKFQMPALCNLGTSFGMGLIVTTTMFSLPVEGAVKASLIGNLGAFVGSVVSVRIMLSFTKKHYGTEEMVEVENVEIIPEGSRIVREGSFGSRAIEAILYGGKRGVDMGVAIIPGVITICTMVMLLTNPMPAGGYTGEIGQGVAFLPWLGEKLSFILGPIFGFSSDSFIAVPITALGSAGAAIGLVKEFANGMTVTGNDIAVFTSMCMCWSGYLSTHIAMMDALKTKEMTSSAILSHTIGGLCAGFAAHIFSMVFL
ncbi:Uncharacterized protein conserved in bacteria [Anaerococcus prevotii]|uniref:Nucleoside recognition domain protein n=1 Tax=Anaerococcus prevotii (strain ATCC 9321 / DSM 20548 / JCM 6508 / NCTC 11806 / PC1) TaxID=525919 RepID=C7REX1_ANAPD|nr:membrane protein [Anaerococcus prevotii]ACV29734.1 conserved hypothetical protein [Anaerococcus prevotii DSM 20548]SUU95406.1 Uncharacterized protein conserved in bacteria [Anaerococcus prevotii]